MNTHTYTRTETYEERFLRLITEAEAVSRNIKGTNSHRKAMDSLYVARVLAEADIREKTEAADKATGKLRAER